MLSPDPLSTYSPYGALLEHLGHSTNEFLFTGEQYGFEDELYYLRARYYNPLNARFMSRDSYDGTVDSPITQNHYAYGNSSPSMYVDPSGNVGMLEISMTINMGNTLRGKNSYIIRKAIKKSLGCTIKTVGITQIAQNGVYMLMAEGLEYVGQSVDTKRRIKQHTYKKAKKIADAAIDWSHRISFNRFSIIDNKYSDKRIRETIERVILEAFSEEYRMSNKVKRPINDVDFKEIKKVLKEMCKK